MKRFLLFMSGFLLRDALEAAHRAIHNNDRGLEEFKFPDPNNPKCFIDELEWIRTHPQHILQIQSVGKKEVITENNFLRDNYYPIRYLYKLKKSGIKNLVIKQGVKTFSASQGEDLKLEEDQRIYNVANEIQKLI